MDHRHSDRGGKIAVALGLGFVLATAVSGRAPAQTEERLPEIRLTYSDLALDTPGGAEALVDRVRTTAERHCAEYGALIVPHSRRNQPRFCEAGVRAQILQALPSALRAVYDDGDRRTREVARGPVS